MPLVVVAVARPVVIDLCDSGPRWLTVVGPVSMVGPKKSQGLGNMGKRDEPRPPFLKPWSPIAQKK